MKPGDVQREASARRGILIAAGVLALVGALCWIVRPRRSVKPSSVAVLPTTRSTTATTGTTPASGWTSQVLSEVDTTYGLGDLSKILANQVIKIDPAASSTSRTAPRILAMSDDGGTLAWCISLAVSPPSGIPRNEWVIVNRKAGPKFDQILQDEVRLSGDGRHIAYPALSIQPDDKEPRWRVIHDGVPGAPYRACRSLVFSPDGKRLAYLAVREDYAGCAVLDGKEISPPLKPDGVTPLAFSPDSQHFAFGGVFAGQASNAQWGIWLDGKLIAGDQHSFRPLQLVFSPDSKRLAIRMRLDKIVAGLADCSFAVMIDGKLDPEFFEVLEGSLRFSDDSKRFVYVAGDDKDNFFLVEDGKPGPGYNFIRPESVRFGGNHLAFVAGTGPRADKYAGTTSRNGRTIMTGQPTLMVDGQPLAGLGGTPVFSADGKRLAYFGERKHPTQAYSVPCVIIDGKPDPPFQQVLYPQFLQFSPNGKHCAYLGANNPNEVPHILVIDGVAHPASNAWYICCMTLDDTGAVTIAMDSLINNAHGIYRRVILK